MSTHTKKIALPRTLIIPANTVGHGAPVKKVLSDGHYEFLVSIGNDETATLIIHEEGLRALNLLSPEPTWI